MNVPDGSSRREAVLDSALRTFGRHGYRKTSMEDVAAEASISRPGLYFLFASKQALFRAAAERALENDLAAAAAALVDPERPLSERVVAAFGHWAGRYVGPLRDVRAVVEDNPEMLGSMGDAASARFESMVTEALGSVAERPAVVRTLISVSLGVKQQAADPEEYLARMREAVVLVLGWDGRVSSR